MSHKNTVICVTVINQNIIFIVMYIFKLFFSSATIMALMLTLVYPALEPVIVRAQVTDTVVVTQTVDAGIAISSPSDITMTHLSTTQNSAVGSATWTVTTNNQAGYTLDVHASTDPALQSGSEQFTDYTETSAGVPEVWNVVSAYEFGFSAYGTHVPAAWDTNTATDCIEGANVPGVDLRWLGFNGTTDIEVASSSSETGTSGIASTICVATEQDGVFAPSGVYTATITATATTQ
ncbi:MAG: hypothetical protein HGA48_04055 [Candidatus Yonathbacteria bacterium]|nr:hypothetical protein [Candidatus Yonathbacteria bacterium]